MKGNVGGGADDRIGAVFSALSDATRRSVLGEVARADSVTATELAETMPVSRQAVVKHLQVLGRAGLVTSARDGREVRYSFSAAPLADAAHWIGAEGANWDARLARLRDLLTEE
jgi:DNA-binding transcriptional ArsR family regulator